MPGRYTACLAIFLLALLDPAKANPVLTGRAEILDGDTVKIGPVELRLVGVDTPETNQDCKRRDGTDYACGKQATEELAAMFRDRIVACTLEGKDVFDRLLAVCRDGDKDINAEIVRLGWGLAFVKYDSRYVAEEREAREAKRGLWEGDFIPPSDWRLGKAKEAEASSPDGCVIKGNISGRSKKRIYHLPHHRDYHKTQIDERAGERWFCSEEEARSAGWRRARL